jgi:hypothetical protein
MPDGSATAHLYRPKLATVLAEGYNFSSFRRDMIAALTVAIVAVPLSMAIAVASGVSPERGIICRRHWRLLSLGSGRQPLPDRRSRGRDIYGKSFSASWTRGAGFSPVAMSRIDLAKLVGTLGVVI